jgi:hypothetical protein
MVRTTGVDNNDIKDDNIEDDNNVKDDDRRG